MTVQYSTIGQYCTLHRSTKSGGVLVQSQACQTARLCRSLAAVKRLGHFRPRRAWLQNSVHIWLQNSVHIPLHNTHFFLKAALRAGASRMSTYAHTKGCRGVTKPWRRLALWPRLWVMLRKSVAIRYGIRPSQLFVEQFVVGEARLTYESSKLSDARRRGKF